MAEVATDAVLTDSSPVAVVDSPVALSDLTPQERQDWRKSGEKPTRKATPAAPDATPSADSSPAAPADPGASTDATSTPASEPGTPTRKKQNAESRKAELDAEIQERLSRRRQLEREVAELEQAKISQAAPAEAPASTPAPGPTDEFPEFEQWLEIAGNEHKGLGAYTKAVLADSDARKAAEEPIQQAKQTRAQAYVSRMQAVTNEAEWKATIAPEIRSILPVEHLPAGAPITMANIVAQELYESSAPYPVQRYLTDHPDEFQGLLHARHPAEVVRRIAALSAQFTTAPASPAPAVKTTTDAPPPPPQIGSRAAQAPDDDLLSAARSGDWRRYRDTANAADIARMKARGR